MRRVLILGGTRWLGGEIAKRALEQGAEVTCLARGESGDVPAGAQLVRADRTQPDAYAQLVGEFDEVVEISYDLGMVQGALDALADRASHWTLVSTVSVYASHETVGADESAETVEPVDLTQYPDAKVAAERATAAVVGDRLLLARSGLIVGPSDGSDRFGYWMARLHRGGQVVVPDAEGQYVQVIDVRDLAAWIALAGREGTTGVIDGIGESHTFADFLQLTAAVTGFDGEFVAPGNDRLVEAGVQYWMGPHSLPLWLPPGHEGHGTRSNAAYLSSGGTLRPLAETIADTLADEVERGVDRERRSGLTASEERAVLAA